MNDLNLGFISGTIVGNLDYRDGESKSGAWKSVEIKLSVFAREYEDRDGNRTKVHHELTVSCSTRSARNNPVYDDVAGLEPGDWISVKYEVDQVRYEKDGEPRTWDKRNIIQVLHVIKGKQNQQPAQSDVSDHVPF